MVIDISKIRLLIKRHKIYHMVYCADCGSEADDSQSFCQECGTSLNRGGSESENDSDGHQQRVRLLPAHSAEDEVVKSRIQSMDNYDFEHFVADLWETMGWETTVSQASVDAGIDVIAEKDKPYPQKKVIQAKRYAENTTVGGPDIQQYASLRTQVDGADSVIVVTSSSFTSSAEDRAKDLNVKLVDGDDIVDMIRHYDVPELVDKYSEVEVREPAPTTAKDDKNTEEVEEPDEADRHPPIEQSSSQSNSTTQQTDDATNEVGRWHYIALAATALTYITVSVSEALFFMFWFASFVTLYIDIRKVRAKSDYNPRAWFYVWGTVGAFGMFVVPMYLGQRYRLVN